MRRREPRQSPDTIVSALTALRFGDAFNPYVDVCPTHDMRNAPEIRRRNLLVTLQAAAAGVDDLWIALEPGHMGARRTGLALTDERSLAAHAARWGIDGIRRATVSGPWREQTAGIVWEALADEPRSVFLWNVCPLHCHEPGLGLSNRRHTRLERDGCSHVTEALIAYLKPARIVAIGREAAQAMANGGHAALQVRHPARGGKAAFLAGVQAA